MFSSLAQLDVLTKASLLGTNLAPVSHTLVPVPLCAAVASSTFPATVSLASGVPVLPKSLHDHHRYCWLVPVVVFVITSPFCHVSIASLCAVV